MKSLSIREILFCGRTFHPFDMGLRGALRKKERLKPLSAGDGSL
jgi:hypothetical protein